MRLPPIQGERIDGRSLPKYSWNADLIFFDGPLLSLFRSERGEDSLFAWLDCDERKNRWAIASVSRDDLYSYLQQQVSLLDVFKNSSSIVVFDATNKGTKTNIVQTVWGDLPQQYLPAEDSYLSEEISTPEAIALAQDLSVKYSIMLDGELYLEDLAGIPKLYQQLYSFHYGLEHLAREAVRTTLSELMNGWHGGLNAVHLFSGLQNVTPSIHRARLNHLQYNSPGHITMELLPKMASKIKVSAESVLADFESAESLYKDVYRFFRENKISGFEVEKGAHDRLLGDAQNQQLEQFVDQFFGLMQWNDYKQKFVSLNVKPLSQIRALLAYYRRLRKFLIYVQSSQVALT